MRVRPCANNNADNFFPPSLHAHIISITCIVTYNLSPHLKFRISARIHYYFQQPQPSLPKKKVFLSTAVLCRGETTKLSRATQDGKATIKYQTKPHVGSNLWHGTETSERSLRWRGKYVRGTRGMIYKCGGSKRIIADQKRFPKLLVLSRPLSVNYAVHRPSTHFRKLDLEVEGERYLVRFQ